MNTAMNSSQAHTSPRSQKGRILLGFLLCMILAYAPLAGCAPQADQSEESIVFDGDVQDKASPPAQEEPSEEELFAQAVEEKLDSMTLEQKVAQMFIVSPEQLASGDAVTSADDATLAALDSYPVGGIVFFGQNLLDTEQTTAMLAGLQDHVRANTDLPLFLCVDEEGGTVSRIGGTDGFGLPNVGNMSDIGATGDPEQARAVATTIGDYLGELGFNVDFAPDADIANNPESDTMVLRSFSADPALDAAMVTAQVEGFASTGMLCAAKHFPGIGGAVGDSHDTSIYSQKTLDEMRSEELVPFTAAIAADVPFVMVGHLSAPNVTGDNTPASLSPAIVTDLLRNELGFQNIIITDSMAMGAVSQDYAPDQIGVAAIEAGDDIILMPEDFHAAYQGVLDAVAQGTISQERIDDSVRRILTEKLAL